MALSMLAKIYDMRRIELPPFVQEVLTRAVPALLGLTHSDGGMGSWQGSGATPAATVQAIVNARDRKSVVEGKRVSVRVDLGGRRTIQTKNNQNNTTFRTKQYAKITIIRK